MVALAESLGNLIIEVAEAEIVPRYRNLAAADIIGKPTAIDPDDLVTSADRAAETALSLRLTELLPGSCVVGEEAVAEDPRILDAMKGAAPVWLVDPIDGTKNFARGQGAFGTMVALVEQGQIVLSAIYLIEQRDLYVAERGAGTLRNGERLRPGPSSREELSGTVYTKFMDPTVLSTLNLAPRGCRLFPPPMCAAFEYARLARGDADFAVYYRLLPWDHAPGALILREAGGVARHLDEKEYLPFKADSLLLLSPSDVCWQTMRVRLQR
jgi:fructose-1,6-bisphosphatase/inositol monophosphatase family enzyme